MELKEVIKLWNDGKEIETVELGGISHRYELAIQVLGFAILERLLAMNLDSKDEHLLEKMMNITAEDVISELNKYHGFSGAQAGAAKNLVWVFYFNGYEKGMAMAPKERIIKLKKF